MSLIAFMNDKYSSTPDKRRFLSTSDVAVALFGRSSRSTVQRVQRLCNSGVLAHVRLGSRGDRLIPMTELDRLSDEAYAVRKASL